ncbi:MAG TPA: AAA family ATPase [Acidobacteriota bacterium]|nr:AAA family ATPase [Acidobacteriota bacterium]
MGKENLYVVDEGQKVPFLRGVITHSLVAKGLSFEDAYETADTVRDLIRPQGEVKKAKLPKIIRKVVKDKFGDSYDLSRRPLKPHSITVEGGEVDLPFSKGVLAQSLQAAGLEPAEGFDIARRIEARILEEGRRRIHRDELRSMTYDLLVEMEEKRIADNYLTWRLFTLDPNSPRKPQRPLVLLFGGATGTGKSSIASEVAHRLGIRHVLSTDSVRQIMRMMFSHELLPAIHTSSYQAWREWDGGDHEKAVVEAFREQTRRVMVGIQAILDRASQEEHSIILEGVHLVPGYLELENFQDRFFIVPVVVTTLSSKALLKRFKERERGCSQRSAERYRTYFEEIRLIQDFIAERAEQENIPIVENDNLEASVREVLSVAANTLRRELKLDRKKLLKQALGR